MAEPDEHLTSHDHRDPGKAFLVVSNVSTDSLVPCISYGARRELRIEGDNEVGRGICVSK